LADRDIWRCAANKVNKVGRGKDCRCRFIAALSAISLRNIVPFFFFIFILISVI